MGNERLRRAISQAGLTPAEVAERVQVDPKSVERWITRGRLPHPRHRAVTAALLNVGEYDVWPEAAERMRARSGAAAELIHMYPHRGAVPGGYWYELIQQCKHHIDVLVYSGLFLPDGHADLDQILTRKADEAVEIRLLLGDPASDAVRRRGEEEGVGGHLAARCHLSLAYLRDLFDVPGVSIRTHATTLYNSIYRFDDDMLVNTHAYGASAVESPVLHLRRLPGARLFDHYLSSFEHVWAAARPAPRPQPQAATVGS